MDLPVKNKALVEQIANLVCRRRRKSAKETDSAVAAAHEALSEMAGSSLRDYDPYFAEDVGAHVHHRQTSFI